MKRFEWIKPGMTVYDVGANVGVRTRQFMAMGAKVVAIEPNPALIPELKKTGATVINAGCGGRTEVLRLLVGQSHTLSTFDVQFITKTEGRFGKHRWNNAIDVQVYTIDQLIRSNYGEPDYIKIDVEGFEPSVIVGLCGFKPKYISYEFTPELEYNHYQCAKMLGKDYEWNYGHLDGEELAFPEWVSLTKLNKHLKQYTDKVSFGDVYGKLKGI